MSTADTEALRQETTALLQSELAAPRQRIADNMLAAGEWASGRTAQSMAVEIKDAGDFVRAFLYARPYFGALETGSRPWARPPKRVPRAFAQTIAAWIEAKGLTLNEWAVAYTIIHEGTALYRSGGRSDIYSNEIPVTLDRLGERMALAYVQHITLHSNL